MMVEAEAESAAAVATTEIAHLDEDTEEKGDDDGDDNGGHDDDGGGWCEFVDSIIAASHCKRQRRLPSPTRLF